MLRPWVLTAFVLGCAACVSIPAGVRATFAEADNHENDYLRARSDAPSPRGFLPQPERDAEARDSAASTSTSLDAGAL